MMEGDAPYQTQESGEYRYTGVSDDVTNVNQSEPKPTYRKLKSLSICVYLIGLVSTRLK